ncbi:MAG: hypothetical protein RID11_15555 [Roseovarius sp.]|jgi:DNA-binding transcriptional ArsR family regulator|uniref:Pyridoxamine 5'-phosphate oxidase n=1 Tax=Sulfitobacter pontiacus TaxID=60137 RepID=A0AAX3AHE0_9RHOB|nr:hypothetical protein [Sulfitobacter pontiacus]MCO4843679.1 hypothetical protein [Yoonia sp.]UOA24762.1 hypothetical protein DSM110277_03209 [Sulfitobacter pontiacus]|tara:strand:- start:681 stop:893 length:213 start_codon:yes stop_codon:yes gene_type:complete
MKVKQIQENADKAEALLKALASRNRLLILCTLVEGERSVGVRLVQVAIPQGFYVRSTPSGSHVEERRGME